MSQNRIFALFDAMLAKIIAWEVKSQANSTRKPGYLWAGVTSKAGRFSGKIIVKR